MFHPFFTKTVQDSVNFNVVYISVAGISITVMKDMERLSPCLLSLQTPVSMQYVQVCTSNSDMRGWFTGSDNTGN